MHAELLNGWLIYVIDAFVFISLAGALAISVDTLRRPRRDFGRLGKAVWLVPQSAYLVCGVIALVATMSTTFNTIVGFLFLVALVQQIAYLLRVVFPSPERRAARELESTTVHDIPEEPT